MVVGRRSTYGTEAERWCQREDDRFAECTHSHISHSLCNDIDGYVLQVVSEVRGSYVIEMGQGVLRSVQQAGSPVHIGSASLLNFGSTYVQIMDTRRVEVQFRHLPSSDAIKEAVRRFFNKLNGLPCSIKRRSVRLVSKRAEPFCDGPYFIHAEVEMQGQELAIDQTPDVDVHVALPDALRDMHEMVKAAGLKRRCAA